MSIDVEAPTKLRIATDTIGPATSSSRGRHLSARCPNPTWDTDAESWNSIVSVPASANERPSFGISSGSSGAKMFP